MKLERVTFTGYDSQTDFLRAVHIQRNRPFQVEYGILASASGAGVKPRCPTIQEVRNYSAALNHASCRVALHICGRWSRQLLQGNGEVFEVIPSRYRYMRIQWNINPPGRTPVEIAKWDVAGAAQVFKANLLVRCSSVIVQRHNESSVDLYNQLVANGVDPVVLFDASGGRGVINETWPEPIGDFCGYAGGFTPENVVERVTSLAEFLPKDQRIWIDMESGVRDQKDWFDLDKVEAVLNALSRFVRGI